jgi:hypothetical protein
VFLFLLLHSSTYAYIKHHEQEEGGFQKKIQLLSHLYRTLLLPYNSLSPSKLINFKIDTMVVYSFDHIFSIFQDKPHKRVGGVIT